MNALIYARVSHDEQVKYGYSINAQLEALIEYCKINKLKIKGRYVDEGISAYSVKKRKSLQKMIEEAENGDIILFTKLDRFSRNVLDANNVLRDLNKKGVAIKAINEEDIDTTTADGKFMFDLRLSLAERERNKTSERINDVFKHKAMHSEIISGTIPFGYKKNNKKYEIDAETAEMVIDMFEYYNLCSSVSKTLRYYNEKYPSQHLSYKIMRYRLSNEIYIGKHKYNDTYCVGIIPQELFYSVQKKLINNIKERKANSVFLFTGLIICPHCGHKLTANRTTYKRKNDNGHIEIYRCNKAIVNRDCSCRFTLNEKKIEKYLINNLKNIINNYRVELEKKSLKQKDYTSEVTKIKKKMTKLKELYLEDLIQKNEYENDYKELNERLKKISSLTVSKPTSKVKNFFNEDGIKKMYEALSREDKRTFWNNIIESMIIFSNKDYDNPENYRIIFK
ncbi:recombinase family protein [Thomasclavelia cocleata]|uniref:recombinase family protein n=4 Tax=Thomasclavelia cocleata TaxID=69824 RepID=UPI00241E264C|nr:recombinase family protein [Thomasclavelia cocleata]